MSYDIRLTEPVDGETIQLPILHVMTGGTLPASYDKETGEFTPLPMNDAWLNITYNYAKYYYEATDGDERFAHDEVSAYHADGTTGPIKTEYGIRGIYGKTGLESIPMLRDMIARIETKYKKDGDWISTERPKRRFFDLKTGIELDFWKDIFDKNLPDDLYYYDDDTIVVYEGSRESYWLATAANAIRPLWQLIAFAELRPDGIWDGD